MCTTEIDRELETLHAHGKAREAAEARGDIGEADEHEDAEETAERIVRLVARRDHETQ